MTKENFEKLCEDNDITWNDKIIITIYNPFKKWYKFGQPKYLEFIGYLLYYDDDEIVKVSVIDDADNLTELLFDFDKILNIKRYGKFN